MMVDETIAETATDLGMRTHVDAILEALGPIQEK